MQALVLREGSIKKHVKIILHRYSVVQAAGVGKGPGPRLLARALPGASTSPFRLRKAAGYFQLPAGIRFEK